MLQEWQELIKLTNQQAMVIERICIKDKEIRIEGEFELPPLAKVSWEDQIFIAAFIKTHGSIKQMERIFGVSYPTIKNRLNKLGEQFDFIKVDSLPSHQEILEQVDKGEITVAQALEKLQP